MDTTMGGASLASYLFSSLTASTAPIASDATSIKYQPPPAIPTLTGSKRPQLQTLQSFPSASTSSSSRFINSSAQGAASSPQKSHTNIMIGSIIGVIVILILCLVGICWRKRRAKKKSGSGDRDEYGEERFRALETQGQGSNGKEVSSGGETAGPDEEYGVKRLRASLSVST
jgi:hypothetical protein